MLHVKNFVSKNQKIGKLGENIVSRKLESNGFVIVDRNHAKKWGELDIIAKKGGVTHFIEVKSVSCVNISTVFIEPEENMNVRKVSCLIKSIKNYLVSNNVGKWQFDLYCVYLDINKKTFKIKCLNDLILY